MTCIVVQIFEAYTQDILKRFIPVVFWRTRINSKSSQTQQLFI